MCLGIIYNNKSTILALVAFKAHLVSGQLPPPMIFLIDTGAEKTMINAVDAEKLGIKYQLSTGGLSIPFFGGIALHEGPVMGGVGGGIKSYIVPEVYLNLVTFLDNHVELHGENLDVLYVPEGSARGIPNLLGMDVLSRFDCSWMNSKSLVNFDRIRTLGRYQCSIVERTALGW